MSDASATSPSRAPRPPSTSTRPQAPTSPSSCGDITVGRLGGPAEISTQKGDINIIEAVHDTVTLRTEHGNISVGAAAGVSAALDAYTSYGRIHNALKNTEGTTALNIHATTAYGDITARSI